MLSETGVCAHLEVIYHTQRNLDGTLTGWWQCDSPDGCLMAFVPETVAAALEAELEQWRVEANDELVGVSPGGRRMTKMENYWMDEKKKRLELEAQVAKLRAYEQEVEEMAELMYQHTMKRLVAESGGEDA